MLNLLPSMDIGATVIQASETVCRCSIHDPDQPSDAVALQYKIHLQNLSMCTWKRAGLVAITYCCNPIQTTHTHTLTHTHSRHQPHNITSPNLSNILFSCASGIQVSLRWNISTPTWVYLFINSYIWWIKRNKMQIKPLLHQNSSQNCSITL